MSSNGNSVAQKFGYNGKEIDEDLGLNWYHYGFRVYDPAIGRFPSIDPASDKFPHVSTYNYAENEPVGSIDLWGLQRYQVNGRERTGGRTKTQENLAGYAFVNKYGHHTAGMIHGESFSLSSTAWRMQSAVNNGAGFTRGDGKQDNAFRHTLGSALVAATFDSETAKDATNVHEGIKPKDEVSIDFDKKLRNNMSEADTIVDLLNNEIGITLAEDLDIKNPLELAKAVLKEFKDNGLWTVKTDEKTGDIIKIERTKIDKNQYKHALESLNNLDEQGKKKN